MGAHWGAVGTTQCWLMAMAPGVAPNEGRGAGGGGWRSSGGGAVRWHRAVPAPPRR